MKILKWIIFLKTVIQYVEQPDRIFHTSFLRCTECQIYANNFNFKKPNIVPFSFTFTKPADICQQDYQTKKQKHSIDSTELDCLECVMLSLPPPPPSFRTVVKILWFPVFQICSNLSPWWPAILFINQIPLLILPYMFKICQRNWGIQQFYYQHFLKLS